MHFIDRDKMTYFEDGKNIHRLSGWANIEIQIVFNGKIDLDKYHLDKGLRPWTDNFIEKSVIIPDELLKTIQDLSYKEGKLLGISIEPSKCTITHVLSNTLFYYMCDLNVNAHVMNGNDNTADEFRNKVQLDKSKLEKYIKNEIERETSVNMLPENVEILEFEITEK